MKTQHFVPTVLLIATMVGLLNETARGASLAMTFDAAEDRVLAKDDYIENGIRMSLVYNHYDIGHQAEDGFVNIDTYGLIEGAIKFQLEGGGLFTLNSVEATFMPRLTDEPAFAEYVFEFSDGSTYTPTPVDGAAVVLADEFAHLPAISYFIYRTRAPKDHESFQRNTHLDNITVTPVPEPSALALVGMSLPLLFLSRRRLANKAEGMRP